MDFVISKGALWDSVDIINPAIMDNLVHIVAEPASTSIEISAQNDHALIVRVVEAESINGAAMSLNVKQILNLGKTDESYDDISFDYEPGDREVKTFVGCVESWIKYDNKVPKYIPYGFGESEDFSEECFDRISTESAHLLKRIFEEFYAPTVSYSETHMRVQDEDLEFYAKIKSNVTYLNIIA